MGTFVSTEKWATQNEHCSTGVTHSNKDQHFHSPGQVHTHTGATSQAKEVERISLEAEQGEEEEEEEERDDGNDVMWSFCKITSGHYCVLT